MISFRFESRLRGMPVVLLLHVIACCALGCERWVQLGSACLEDAPCLDGGAQADLDAGTHATLDAQMVADLDADSPSDAALDAHRCAPSWSDGGLCVCQSRVREGLLAHWPLDETSGQLASDATGHAPVGVLTNFSQENPWVLGNFAGALQYGGGAEYVQVGPVVGAVKTLSLWLKVGGTQVTTDHTPMQLPTSHGPLDEWTNPEKAYVDDGMVATAASLVGTKQQHWGGFRLAQQLPSGATIQGITVTVHTANLGVLGSFGVELSTDSGKTHTDSRYSWGQLIAGSDLRQAGGQNKLWSRTWTADDFSADHFRVWASFGGIANVMGLDFLGVEVWYAPQVTARAVIALSPGASVGFGGADGRSIVTSGWPDSSIFVNGRLGGTVDDGWNHVVIVSQAGITASDVQLGSAPASQLSFPFQGLMDDVVLLDDALTPEEVSELDQPRTCSP